MVYFWLLIIMYNTKIFEQSQILWRFLWLFRDPLRNYHFHQHPTHNWTPGQMVQYSTHVILRRPGHVDFATRIHRMDDGRFLCACTAQFSDPQEGRQHAIENQDPDHSIKFPSDPLSRDPKTRKKQLRQRELKQSAIHLARGNLSFCLNLCNESSWFFFTVRCSRFEV